MASGGKVSDAVRVAKLMDNAREPVEATLCQSPLDQRRSVDSLKLWIREASFLFDLIQGQLPVQVNAVGDGRTGKKGKGLGQRQTRARMALEARARIARFTGTQANKQHSSKDVPLFVRSGVTNSQSADHDYLCRKPEQLPEFKNPWKKVKVSTHCIGAMPKTMKWRSMWR